MSEFTAFNARNVQIKVAALFPYVTRSFATLEAVEDAKARLHDFIEDQCLAQEAYSIVVASHTFDEYGDWELEVVLKYDTDVAEMPSVTDLLQLYFDIEEFFDNDDLLKLVCWYTGFAVGDHGGGSD